LHDLVHLERRGIPAVGIATAPFADEAIEQARRLGMPGSRVVYIPHPVQLLTDGELAARADAAFPAVLEALTEPATPGSPPAPLDA
jgi:hypothetical protein